MKLAEYTHSYVDDLDCLHLVWDRAAGEVTSVCYYTTRAGLGEADWELVEATDADVEQLRELVRARRADALQIKLEQAGTGIDRGARVEVVRGRKVPIGTTGVIGWIGEGKWGWRVGIDTDDGERVWTALGNVEKSLSEDFAERAWEQAQEQAQQEVEGADLATLGRLWLRR